MQATTRTGLNLTVRDVSGQRPYAVRSFPRDATVRELIGNLVAEMNLPANDPGGMPYVFQAFLDREGRHLRGAEIVGDVLEEDDEIALQPDIQAGTARPAAIAGSPAGAKRSFSPV